jgi:hypothetical protein
VTRKFSCRIDELIADINTRKAICLKRRLDDSAILENDLGNEAKETEIEVNVDKIDEIIEIEAPKKYPRIMLVLNPGGRPREMRTFHRNNGFDSG